MRLIGYILFFALATASVSCKKAEDRKCFKSAGEETDSEIFVTSYDHLHLGSHIKYVLVQDTVEKVILTGGKNLLNFISVEVVNNELRIANNNKCNFLRSYKKKVTAEVHLKNLKKMHFEGTEPLECKGQLVIPYLTLFVRDGAGHVDLNINAISMNSVITHGWGNVKIHGKTNYSRMEIRSNGRCDTYELDVKDSIHVISTTAEIIKVNADNVLFRAETSAGGDIWYKGSPSQIDYNQYGTGKLVNKN